MLTEKGLISLTHLLHIFSPLWQVMKLISVIENIALYPDLLCSRLTEMVFWLACQQALSNTYNKELSFIEC